MSDESEIAILQGALDEFAAHGFGGATTRGIAARVSLSHGLIRYYFETKEKLWYAAVDYLFERLNKETALTAEESERMADGDVDVFRRWLRGYVRYCAKHPEHARIIYQESVEQSDRLKNVVDRHARRGHLASLAIIKKLIASGVFPKTATPISVMYILAASAQNFFALAEEVRASVGYDPLTEEAIEAHATTLIDIMLPERAR